MLIRRTDRLELHSAEPKQARAHNAYYIWNAEHLAPWEPRRSAGYHVVSAWRRRLRYWRRRFRSGQSLPLSVRLVGQEEIIGVCHVTSIIRGPFQAGTLGYSIDAAYEGQGYMYEALGATLSILFDEWQLHRVMANYIPSNARSGTLLKRLGFEEEGRARAYLQIAGKWQDHILTSKLNLSRQIDENSEIS